MLKNLCKTHKLRSCTHMYCITCPVSYKPAAHVSQPAITFPQLTDGKDKEEIEVDSDDPDYVEW